MALTDLEGMLAVLDEQIEVAADAGEHRRLPCQSGCPSCVGPEGASGPLAKSVASSLLSLLTATVAAA
jgi:hypothetical protein